MSALRILPFLALIGVCSSQTSDCSYLSLLEHLNLTTTNDVVQIMRPVKNWTTPTIVLMDMLLYGILDVDEKSQTVTSHVWIQMSWTNEILKWRPPDFCGIRWLSYPLSKLWVPDIFLQEDASDIGTLQKSQFASVNAEGWVFSTARQRLTSTCQLKLWLFPFDQQNCTFTFGPLNFQDTSVVLGTWNDDSTLAHISEKVMVTLGEWELKNLDIILSKEPIRNATADRLTYIVTIARKPMLYIINLIVPLFYLLVLDLASFFISEARGEKLSFKITILLSISVLLLILQDMLPSTENSLPLIASYCVAVFAMVGLSVLEAMLMSFLNDLDGYCALMTRGSVDDKVEIQLEDNYHDEPAGAEEKGQGKPEKGYLPPYGHNGHNLLKLILEEVKAARQEAERQEKERKTPGRYSRVAHIIDTVYFALYFLTVTVFLGYMYTVWAHHYVMSD